MASRCYGNRAQIVPTHRGIEGYRLAVHVGSQVQVVTSRGVMRVGQRQRSCNSHKETGGVSKRRQGKGGRKIDAEGLSRR